jgi:hypothetical protein
MSYNKFILMMIISLIIRYAVMFLIMDQLSHYHTSTTRIYMALLMIAPNGCRNDVDDGQDVPK